ncbi:MAG: UDP-glucose 4-epimerase GalE [Flavobacteriales bacterium]|nr:MAG: UDP-glucose 4-epimerase GalE [Flavobacteriales bacterium]
MKILVSGGGGYIGSHTIIELENGSNFEAFSVDNFCNSTPKTFERIAAITGKSIKNSEIDLTRFEDTKSLFEKTSDIKAIIHFAAFKTVPESIQNPLLYYHNNLNSLLNLLKCAKEFNIPHFIFSSSCSVYGNLEKLPVTENTPMNKSQSPYATTKQMGEQIIEDFAKVNPEISFISLRYFNPVGAHTSGKIGEVPMKTPDNLVPIITETAAGLRKKLFIHGTDYKTRDGSCVRDYIHVSDIADAHVKALQYLIDGKNEKNHEVFNLGIGQGVTVLEVINAFEKATGVKLNYETGPRRTGDVEAIYSDNTKAEKLLGWKPQYSLEDMMASAWKWQLALLEENQ